MRAGLGFSPQRNFSVTCWWCGAETLYYEDGPHCKICGHDIREAFEDILKKDPIPKGETEVKITPEDEIARLEENLEDAEKELEDAHTEAKEKIAEKTKRLKSEVGEMNLALHWACRLLDQQQIIPPVSKKEEHEWDEMTEKQRLRQWRIDLIRMGGGDADEKL